MATPGLPKVKVFWIKDYDAIISVQDVTNKTLSYDSYYIADAVIWPKFGYYSIFMREVIITSILWGLDQKKKFFWEVLLVHVQKFSTGTRYGLET